jgi:hypothetical protein
VQKLAEGHETEWSLYPGSTRSPEDHDVPLKMKALPPGPALPTAAQNDGDAHDTVLSKLPVDSELDHDVPLKARTIPLVSAAMQKFDEVHDTEVS